MSPNLQSIIDEKIQRFRFAFAYTSKNVYTNHNTKKIYSPGEFGSFREETCKDFIRCFIPQRLSIASGILLNHTGDVSSQCDIVIYDRNNTPLIENERNQRFFPVESVAAIGEIKSDMSKRNLKIALNKLARNKALASKNSPNSMTSRKAAGFEEIYNPLRETAVSFLICNELSFKATAEEIDKLYDSDIEHWQKHNMILSINDGLYLYRDDEKGKISSYPETDKELRPCLIMPNPESIPINYNYHLNYFTHLIFNATSTVNSNHTELVDYLDLRGGRFSK